MVMAMSTIAQFVRCTDLRVGEARVLRVRHNDGDVLVYLDVADNVQRVRAGAEELPRVPWGVQQVLDATLDPHAVCVE